MSTRRLNDPRFLRYHAPLNGHAEDVVGDNDGTWAGDESYAENHLGIQAATFDGTLDIIEIDDVLTNELAAPPGVTRHIEPFPACVRYKLPLPSKTMSFT